MAMAITAEMLFLFLAELALVCILVLQALTQSSRLKIGYVALALTFVPWLWQLYALRAGPGTWWLYALPIVWLLLLFRYAFPVTRRHEYPPVAGEPYLTQESLAGAPGRREALTFYFLLLLIGLVLGLVFYQFALPYRWGGL